MIDLSTTPPQRLSGLIDKGSSTRHVGPAPVRPPCTGPIALTAAYFILNIPETIPLENATSQQEASFRKNILSPLLLSLESPLLRYRPPRALPPSGFAHCTRIVPSFRSFRLRHCDESLYLQEWPPPRQPTVWAVRMPCSRRFYQHSRSCNWTMLS